MLKSRNILNGFTLFQGGSNVNIYDTDCEYLFRQESTFQYLFGVNEPDFYGGMNIESGESYLFIPRLDPSYAVWQGHIKTTEEYKDIYQVNHVYYTDEITTTLQNINCQELFVMSGTNRISGSTLKEVNFNGIELFKLNQDILYNIVCDCRAIKSEKELNLLRFVNKISVEAHTYVMQQVKNCSKEKDLEAEFLYYIERMYGCRYVSYTCVCCTGSNSAILHYGHAGAPLSNKIKQQDILLLDMGAEYFGYDSDITCSYPASGKFNEKQKLIYQAVLDTQRTVETNIRAGVSWISLQRICEIEIVKHLSKIGIILPHDKTPEQLVDLGLSKIFFPHSFGHYMGLDVHDVQDGYPQYDSNVENPTSRNILLKTTW
jgi:Xaa-Pro dipeptidase